ncbi:VOC family protein [Lacinutrix chionoecetis]
MKTQNPVVWFEIYVDDMNRAHKFYETVLQLKIENLPTPDTGEEMQMMAFPMEMDGAGAAGALVKMKDVKAGGNSTLIYFRSDDCAIEEARIEKAGGKVMKSKQSLGEYGFMVLASDTEGNMFGIHSEA